MPSQGIEQTSALPISPIDMNSDMPNGSNDVECGSTVELRNGDFLLVDQVSTDNNTNEITL